MSEFSYSPNTSKKFSSLLLADLFNLCFFVLSHPLYFSYFIFFSPYLLKLLSFLSPLFITTSLLVLAYLTFSPTTIVQDHIAGTELSKFKLGCLISTYQTVLERLQKSKVDGSDGDGSDGDHEEFRSFVELEAYKIVFDTSSSFEIDENQIEEMCSQVLEAQVEDVSLHEDHNGGSFSSLEDASDDVFDDTLDEVACLEVETLESFLQEERKEEKEEEVKPAISTHSNKVVVEDDGKVVKGSMPSRASKDLDNCGDWNGNGNYYSKSMSNSQRVGIMGSDLGEYYNMKAMEEADSQMSPSSVGSFGSMRKEKEWRRTLACKLFEERHQNVDGGGEGMDMLWETYDETESLKVMMKGKSKSKKGKKSNGKVEGKYGGGEEEEEEEDEFDDGQLCCLQALKFSAGKMNLGMGRPNLVKFSKALKGFGWLHHVTKHAKKGYH